MNIAIATFLVAKIHLDVLIDKVDTCTAAQYRQLGQLEGVIERLNAAIYAAVLS